MSVTYEEHRRESHITDGSWHDNCGWCRHRRQCLTPGCDDYTLDHDRSPLRRKGIRPIEKAIGGEG